MISACGAARGCRGSILATPEDIQPTGTTTFLALLTRTWHVTFFVLGLAGVAQEDVAAVFVSSVRFFSAILGSGFTHSTRLRSRFQHRQNHRQRRRWCRTPVSSQYCSHRRPRVKHDPRWPLSSSLVPSILWVSLSV